MLAIKCRLFSAQHSLNTVHSGTINSRKTPPRRRKIIAQELVTLRRVGIDAGYTAQDRRIFAPGLLARQMNVRVSA